MKPEVCCLAKLLEKDLERAVRDILALDGWIVRKMEQNYSERKRKSVGEPGMADLLAIRYSDKGIFANLKLQKCYPMGQAEVVWLELKRLVASPERVRRNGVQRQRWPRATQAANHQKAWHVRERERGALTLIAGEDFPATIDGFRDWYRASGLARH